MKLTNSLKIAAFVATALTVASAGMASAQVDPTQGRIDARKQAAAQAEFVKCREFSRRVLGAALNQANGNQAKRAAAYRHYRGNIQRCRAASFGS